MQVDFRTQIYGQDFADTLHSGIENNPIKKARKINQSTKHTRLIIRLKSGAQVSGKFHVDKETIAAVRPSDAIRECRGSFIVLTDVEFNEDGESSIHSSIMVQIGDISLIKLPESWDVDHTADVVHDSMGIS